MCRSFFTSKEQADYNIAGLKTLVNRVKRSEANPKIPNTERTIAAHKNLIGLQITVNNVALGKVRERSARTYLKE